MELNQKLEEVNTYLEEQSKAREKIDQMRDDNDNMMRKEFEKTKKELSVIMCTSVLGCEWYWSECMVRLYLSVNEWPVIPMLSVNNPDFLLQILCFLSVVNLSFPVYGLYTVCSSIFFFLVDFLLPLFWDPYDESLAYGSTKSSVLFSQLKTVITHCQTTAKVRIGWNQSIRVLTIRSHLHFKPEFTSRGLKNFSKKLPPVEIDSQHWPSLDLMALSDWQWPRLRQRLIKNGLYRIVWRCTHCTKTDNNTDSHWVLYTCYRSRSRSWSRPLSVW